MILVVLINSLLVTVCLLMRFHGPAAIYAGSMVAVGSGAIVVFRMTTGAGALKLTLVLSSALLIGYGAGTLNTLLSYNLAGEDGVAAMGVPAHFVTYALLLLLLSGAALMIASYFETPLLDAHLIIPISWKQERFLWFSLACLLYAYKHGDIGYQGTAVEAGSGHISALGFIVGGFSTISVSLAAIGVVQSRGGRRWRFLFLGLSTMILLFPAGRRAVFYTLLITIFAVLRLSGRQFRFSLGRQWPMLLAFMAIIYASNYAFMALRLSIDTSGMTSQDSREGKLLRVFPLFAENLLTNQAGVKRYLSDNLQQRTYVIRYLALLGRGGDTPSPLYGKDALFSVQMVIPDLLYQVVGADKTPVRNLLAEEVLANEHFGLPVTDEANSILTAGIIDFGVAGVLLYPILLAILFRAFLLLIKEVASAEGELISLLMVLSALVVTECELATYLQVLRGIAQVLVVWAIVHSLPGVLSISHLAALPKKIKQGLEERLPTQQQPM